ISVTLDADDTPDVSSGPAYIRIKQGATISRDLVLDGPNGSNYSAIWDGKKAPPSTEYVGEGQYQIMVIDRAENQGVNMDTAYSIPLDIITSDFTFTAVKQTSPTTLLLTFSQDVDPVGAVLPARYALTTNPGIDAGDLPQTAVPNGKTVELTFNTSFTHGTTYTLIVMDGFASLDGYPFQTQQSLTFVADGQGPQLSQVTFDGVANSQEFNVVFDEVVTASSATSINNYQLFASGTTQVDLDPARIFVRADGRSVRLKVLSTAHIKEGITYTIVAKNIKDVLGNAVTTQTLDFVGRDVTPPAIKDNIFVFSNPANPLDISIVVQSNETLKEPPTAAVSQDGGTAQTIKLQASSSNPKLYLGGVHLTRAGTASIKVTATDMTGNTAVETVSFATAYVNASVLASVSTPDQAFTAEFTPGSLKQDSLVAVIPTPLQKQAPTSSVRGGIRPSVLAGMSASEKQSRRFETVGGEASEELTPVDVGYTVTVPTDQLAGAYSISMALPGGALPTGAGLYQAGDSGKWSSITGAVKDGRILASVTSAGTFALLRDVLAPRVNMLTKIEEKTTFRSERPTFEWSVLEEGSGITEDGVKVLIDGTESAGQVTLEAGRAAFTPLDRLVDGNHTIVLKAKDHAGNERVMPVVRFAVSPALQVFEIIQFPNPARSRATMRVATNREDVDPDDVTVEIFDISGERVKCHDGLSFMKRFDGSRRVLDMVWDLTSDAGRRVANGIYLAKIKLRDPDSGKTTKVTHKIAVLR
ncbi:MAG TPA: Ig-like domain-containing protein, partial [Candidatus Ozemobacteraceae bacterium]|nr:Ig-like domain-containing protein [Candidatus Ozemobacteraceae bacterium]